MSEAERRTGYDQRRVLIDASRILDPQFAQRGLAISGAQVELLRNVVEYLRRDTTFVDEYHDGYYLRATTGDFDQILAVVADLEDKLMGADNTVWGYNNALCVVVAEPSTPAADVTIPFPTVPAGEVWIVESFDIGTTITCTLMLGYGFLSAITHYFLQSWAPLANRNAFWNGRLVLKEGDRIEAKWFGCASGSSIRATIAGYKMEV